LLFDPSPFPDAPLAPATRLELLVGGFDGAGDMGRPGDLVRAWDLGAGDFPRALCSTQAGAGRRGAAAAEARIAGVGQGVNEQPRARKRIRTRAGCAGATRGISYGDFPREELRGGIGGPVTALTLPRSGNFSKIWAGLN
jgi:hypothetical protein